MKLNFNLLGQKYFGGLTVGGVLRTLFLFVLVSASTPGASAQLGESRQLTLMHPQETDFEAILNASYPGFTNLDNYRAIRPFLVLVRNDSSHSAMSYAIEWDIRSRDGMSHPLENHFIQKYFGPVAQRRAFGPRELRLISPLFDVSRAQYPEQRNLIVQLLSTFSSHPPYSSTNIISITAAVDAVIYEDGRYSGPDHFQLLKRYECVREAEHDEASRVLELLAANTAIEDVVAILQQHIQAGRTAKTSAGDRDSICTLHRGEEAQVLLAVYRRSGVEVLRQRASAMATRPPERISRLGSND
jgi:hypothetical protein